MNKDTLELKNGTVIELETGASLGNMVVVFQNRATMITVWGELTEENLSEVQIRNGAGVTVGRYNDLVLVSETSVIQDDETICTSFCLREKTGMEKRMDAMEEGQEVQDEAIMDMAGAVSAMAEMQNGGER